MRDRLDRKKDMMPEKLFKPIKDGTVDLYMSPTAPAGMESNWVQTIPDRGFFIYFRLFGPEEALFNGTWKLNDFELVK